MKRHALSVLLIGAFDGVASAQEKPRGTGYFQQGCQVIHLGVGGKFLVFVLKKDTAIVYCSVRLQSGDTSTCRTVK